MTEIEFFNYACKSNGAAVEFLRSIGKIAQTFDDLYDGDREVSRERIVALLWQVMCGFPANQFYRAYSDNLNPILCHIFLDWRDANELEVGTNNDKAVAYVLRDTADTLIIHCALLIGGPDWAQVIAKESRQRTYGSETLEDYKEKLP